MCFDLFRDTVVAQGFQSTDEQGSSGMINRDTIIGGSIGTFIAVLGALWIASGEVQGYIAQISMNTVAIQSIGQSMELSRIDRIIEGKQKEIRDKEIMILKSANNPDLVLLLQEQVKELADDLTLQLNIRECVVDPAQIICK
jgi:hypothetical protein